MTTLKSIDVLTPAISAIFHEPIEPFYRLHSIAKLKFAFRSD
jgi:hypothetical protein